MSTTFALSDMVKIYSKPSLGVFVLRKPKSEARSPATAARMNARRMDFAERMRGKKIATACKGKKARAFYGCLRTEGSRAYHGR